MRTLLFLLLIVLFSGCFEIREEVNLKADGSGEVVFVANLSQSKGKVNQYLKLERVEGYRVPKQHEVDGALQQIKTALHQAEGINYVQTKADWSNYVFSVNVRFANLDALNAALQLVSEQFGHLGLPTIDRDNFRYARGRFERHFDFPPEPEEFAALPSMQRFMLESAQMISIYRFEQDIREHSHPLAQRSPSGRAIMLRLPLADLAKGTGTLANSIRF